MSVYGIPTLSHHVRDRRNRADSLVVDELGEEIRRAANGQFTCVVCRRGPVFDTLAVGLVHARGKAHLAEKERRRLESAERAAEWAKRNQAAMVAEEAEGEATVQPLLAHTRQRVEKALAGEEGPRAAVGAKRKRDCFFSVERAIHLPPPPSSSQNTSVAQTAVPQTRAKKKAKRDSSGGPLTPEALWHQYHTHLTQAGWIRDSTGKWNKDEEAEFDSDEEEPMSFEEFCASRGMPLSAAASAAPGPHAMSGEPTPDGPR